MMPPWPAPPGRWWAGCVHRTVLLLALLGLGLAAARARGQNNLTWVTNYYAVTGSTFGEIMESLDQSRPAWLRAPLVGLTEWSIHWHMNMVPSDKGYRCSTFTTRTTLTNTLPFWRAPTNASYRVTQAWRNFVGNLAIHEGGHSRIALAAAAEIHQEVRKIKDAPDMDSLRNQINDTAMGVLRRYQAKEVEYDRITAHGAHQFAPRDSPDAPRPK